MQMRKPTSSTIVIASLLGILVGVAFSSILTAKSSAQGEDFPFILIQSPLCGSGDIMAVDKRLGDAWCLTPTLLPEHRDRIRPRYMGNLGFDGANQLAKGEAILELRKR